MTIALAWLAAALCLGATLRPSLRLVNESIHVRRAGRLVLDRSIPLGAGGAAALAATSFWLLWPIDGQATDALAFPLAIVAASGVLGLVTLGALVRSCLDPRGSPLRR